MTNAMIILLESVKLMEEGKLQGTGEKIMVEMADGKKELDVPEPIHTYQRWKELGYQVQKGEKAVAKFPIWQFVNGKMKLEEVKDDVDVEQNENKHYCHMKMSSFFAASQVQKIEEVKQNA